MGADVAASCIGANVGEEVAEPRAAPLADDGPALDANQARDLAVLRQAAELDERQGRVCADAAIQRQFEAAGIDLWCVVHAVEGVEARRSGNLRGRESEGERAFAEERRLHPIVPGGHQAQEAVGKIGIL